MYEPLDPQFLAPACDRDDALPPGLRIIAVHCHARTIPRSRRAHIRGIHPVMPGHQATPFESLNEKYFIDLISALPGFQRIQSQPITVEYLLDGRRRQYTPDFLVDFDPVPSSLLGYARQTFVEVKPFEIAIANLAKLSMLLSLVRVATGRAAALACIEYATTARSLRHVH